MTLVGAALVVSYYTSRRRDHSSGSKIDKATSGRVLIAGVLLTFAGVGGIVTTMREPAADGPSNHLLLITNRCSVPLELTVTGVDGQQRSYGIVARGADFVPLRSGDAVTVRSSQAETEFTISRDAPKVMPEWVVEGVGCLTLERTDA